MTEPRDALGVRLQQALADEYVIVRMLGRGAMGAVYLARELALDRLVAIKMLPPDAAANDERRARFRREAQLAAKLSHPNIVPLHSFGEKAGLLYYVMGFVRGESLADRLRREGTLPPEEARTKLAELADALDYAHARGIVHRDLKPDNILLDDESGRPLLADFGIARTMGLPAAVVDIAGIEGTLHYMSPEQAAGAAAPDGRSDLYSLGVVGYTLLTGEPPFASATTFQEFAARQATQDPPPLTTRAPEVAADLAVAIMRCLERRPDARWPDARALKDALGAALDDDPDRLPGELREVAGSVFYSVVVGWLLANAAAVFLAPALGWSTTLVAGCFVAVTYLATALFHHRKGIAWGDMRRVSLWPPGWWPFWWPRGWRRPGDLWHRLPATVRRLRIAYGMVVGATLIGLPIALRVSSDAALGVGFAAQLVVTALMLFSAWWAHRSGIPNNADLRSLVLRSTSDRRFWKRPVMAQRLLPASDARRLSGGRQAPAELLRLMSDAVPHMRGRTRETGIHAIEVARNVCAEIVKCDTDAARGSDGGALAGDGEVTRRRERLASGLSALCEAHLKLPSEDSDAALRRLTVLARSLTLEMSASDAHDHIAESATLAGTMEASARSPTRHV